jgi:RHS repeat-associated protein
MPTSYKFTGQRLDDSTGLYYYGARYYDAVIGRFVQADTIVPNPGNPQSLNRYSYVNNNPLKYTDPTGHMVAEDSTAGPTPPPDPYDLTYWLVMEMNQHSVSPEIMQIWVLNQLAAGSGLPGTSCKALAFHMYIQLVADRHRWDFKYQIEYKLGDSIELGGEWFEFSTPGNIHYGFVGAAAGFSRTALRIGAGVAQAWDDLRSDEPDATIGGLDTWFDASTDFYAVEFGVQLYENYGSNVTVEEFNALLVSYTDRSKLAYKGPPQDVRPVPSGWPYAPGAFNGPVAPWPPFLFSQH